MDINTTVYNSPINIEVIPQPPILIDVAVGGIQGPAGAGGSTNTGILTGVFYPLNSNPSGYSTSGNSFNSSGYITSGSFFNLQTNLNSGIISQFISYGQNFSIIPSGISCILVNNIDSFIYDFSIYSVNSSGFSVGFSDYLSNSGYILNSQILL